MNENAKQLHRKKGLALAEKMTVREQISQLEHASKGVKRLGILPYNW